MSCYRMGILMPSLYVSCEGVVLVVIVVVMEVDVVDVGTVGVDVVGVDVVVVFVVYVLCCCVCAVPYFRQI